jgi:hypothetical protein
MKVTGSKSSISLAAEQILATPTPLVCVKGKFFALPARLHQSLVNRARRLVDMDANAK